MKPLDDKAARHEEGFLLALEEAERQLPGDRRRERGAKTPEERAYQIAEIRDHQLEIIRLLTVGVKPKDIARHLRITPQTVYNIRNHPVVRQMLRQLHAARASETADILSSIRGLAPLASDLLREVLEFRPGKAADENALVPSVREQVDAAKTVLKLAIPPDAGLAPDAALTPEDIEAIKREALLGAGQVEEARIVSESPGAPSALDDRGRDRVHENERSPE